MDFTVFNGVLAEVGPLIDAGAVTAQDDGGFWTFEFEDEAPLYLECSARCSLLVLSGEVAGVPQDARAELFEMLLLYNDQASGTGGARFAIDARGGNVVLSLDVFAEALEANGLAGLLQDFRALRRAWRPIVSQWPGARAAEGCTTAGGAAPGLRV